MFMATHQKACLCTRQHMCSQADNIVVGSQVQHADLFCDRLHLRQDKVFINVLATTSRRHLRLLATAGGTSYPIPAPSVSSCAFAEFNYALKQLQSNQQAKPAALAREAASGRGGKEPQLASAFTREEATAGCAVDVEDDDAGEIKTPRSSTHLQGQELALKVVHHLHNGACLALCSQPGTALYCMSHVQLRSVKCRAYKSIPGTA